MFGIDSGEILIIALVALVVIGPKDLPRAMRTIGNFVGKARGMARHFRTGFDAMVREVDLEDMEKQWRADNERIMREHPVPPAESDWGKPGQVAGGKPGQITGTHAAPPASSSPAPVAGPNPVEVATTTAAASPIPPPDAGAAPPIPPAGAAPPIPQAGASPPGESN